jgi:hypothetical protein
MPSDNLNDLRAFVAVARERSFTRAAAPSYLARRSSPKTPRELIGHNCIRVKHLGRAVKDEVLPEPPPTHPRVCVARGSTPLPALVSLYILMDLKLFLDRTVTKSLDSILSIA